MVESEQNVFNISDWDAELDLTAGGSTWEGYLVPKNKTFFNTIELYFWKFGQEKRCYLNVLNVSISYP